MEWVLWGALAAFVAAAAVWVRAICLLAREWE